MHRPTRTVLFLGHATCEILDSWPIVIVASIVVLGDGLFNLAQWKFHHWWEGVTRQLL